MVQYKCKSSKNCAYVTAELLVPPVREESGLRGRRADDTEGGHDKDD